MKKSTLITTIAMIVVVVVALSTATYAWFSSSATAVASTNFTTNASGDWSMIIGTATPSTGAIAFDGVAVDTATLTPTGLQKGLWAPTAVIASTISDATTEPTLAYPAAFVNATKSGTSTYNVAGLLTQTYDSSLQTPGLGDGRPAPFAIRVMNVSGKQKTLQLNITLNAKNTGLTNSMFAASAVRFYVYEMSNNGQNGTGAAYTSGYTPIASAETATVNALTSPSGTVTAGTTENMTTGLSGSYLGKDNEQNDAVLTKAVQIANYSVANIASNFTKAESANDNLGIAINDYVRTYTFDMQTYEIGGWCNIIIYAWIDGWVANGSAASANFDVNFGFTSVPTVTPAQGN